MANLQQEVFNLRRQVASLKKQIKGGYTPISEPKYTPQNLSRRVSSIQKKLDKGYTPIPRETANTVPLQTSGRYRRSPFEPSEFSYMTPSYPNTKSYTDQDLERIENAEMKLYRKPGEVLKPRYTPQNLSRRSCFCKGTDLVRVILQSLKEEESILDIKEQRVDYLNFHIQFHLEKNMNKNQLLYLDMYLNLMNMILEVIGVLLLLQSLHLILQIEELRKLREK